MSEPTKEMQADILAAVNAVHDVLEKFTPPEALNVLTIVRFHLKAEIRDSRE